MSAPQALPSVAQSEGRDLISGSLMTIVTAALCYLFLCRAIGAVS